MSESATSLPAFPPAGSPPTATSRQWPVCAHHGRWGGFCAKTDQISPGIGLCGPTESPQRTSAPSSSSYCAPKESCTSAGESTSHAIGGIPTVPCEPARCQLSLQPQSSRWTAAGTSSMSSLTGSLSA